MKQTLTTVPDTNIPIKVLLADDDSDDRYFFQKSLKKINIPTVFTTVVDGERLMNYLYSSDAMPDVLFLDLNMPCKNGFECLVEIKLHEKWKHLPVIIFSTSVHEDIADLLYNNGAFYYVRKTDISELQIMLHQILTMVTEKKFLRPARDRFILRLAVA